MRRIVFSITVAFALIGVSVGMGGLAATAAPTPGPSAEADQVPGKKVCTIKDDRLIELSGLAATKSGYVVINDSSDVDSRNQVFFLDGKCKVVNAVPYSSPPWDPEDLTLSPDSKTLWIADIGDNPTGTRRKTVALWNMPVDGSKKPTIQRFSYPDGPHDAEALLFNGDGTPIIVTKDPGTAGLYAPAGPLTSSATETIPMKKLGEVKIPRTTTPHEKLGAVARMLITGGATAPDGSRVVLRTYTDAFEWDVKDGDVVAALTKGQPRVTPLPNEPWGEAITYTPDGKAFLTVSEGENPTILTYTPATKVASDGVAGKSGNEQSWLNKLSLDDITYLIAAVGVLGAILVGLGVFGILRARRRKPSAGGDGQDDGAGRKIGRQSTPGVAPRPGGRPQPYDEVAPGVAAPPPTGGVYGGAPGRAAPAGGRPGAVYGGGASGRTGGASGYERPGGAVYGGRPGGGGVYGGGDLAGEGGYRGGSGDPGGYDGQWRPQPADVSDDHYRRR